QTVHALRSGNPPDGSQRAPIMPWMNYDSILDQDDAMAIAAYLKSLPPISHKNLDRIPPGGKLTGSTHPLPAAAGVGRSAAGKGEQVGVDGADPGPGSPPHHAGG